MIKQEYYSVKEISQQTGLSSRHIRRIVQNISNEHSKDVLYKNQNEEWRIHHLLLSNFKPQRIRKNKYYALTIDPVHHYSDSDLHRIMAFVYSQMPDEQLEINYVIEPKKATQVNHLHCFVKCQNRKKLIDTIRIGFSDLSYREAVVFDLAGWKAYIMKNNNNITTLKKHYK